MIVIKVELWPGGDESRAEDLGKAIITNVSGLADISAYEARLLKGAKYSRRPGEVYKVGRVDAFPRADRRWGPWELLALALEATVGSRVVSLKRFLASVPREPEYGAGFQSADGAEIGFWAGPTPDLADLLARRPEDAHGGRPENKVPVIVRFDGEASTVTHVWLDELGWAEV